MGDATETENEGFGVGLLSSSVLSTYPLLDLIIRKGFRYTRQIGIRLPQNSRGLDKLGSWTRAWVCSTEIEVRASGP